MTSDLTPALADPFIGVEAAEVAPFGPLTKGKVRDLVDLGESLALIATDRISAFDHVLGTVPYRGQVLNELAAWWFERIDDLVPSHIESVPDANVTIAKKCTPLPVEVVVRGRLSGSTSTALWTKYQAGEREIYGIVFPDGMRKNDQLETPVITPTTKAAAGGHDERMSATAGARRATTKAAAGGHDEPITEAEIVERGLVAAELWDQVRTVALAVFARGSEVSAGAGLVLVDTKYEFGQDADGVLTIIDEVHTPDSSRFWRAASVEQRLAVAQEPENLDKEHIRLAYARDGYRGIGTPEPLSTELAIEAASIYQETFTMLTGRALQPASYPATPRVLAALEQHSTG